MTPSAMITLVTVAILMAVSLGLLILAMCRAAGSAGLDSRSNRHLLKAEERKVVDLQAWVMHDSEDSPETGSSPD